MFQASLCPSSGEQRPCYCIWCTALVLLDVDGSGCGALRCRMRALLGGALVGKPEGKSPLKKPRRRWVDNIGSPERGMWVYRLDWAGPG